MKEYIKTVYNFIFKGKTEKMTDDVYNEKINQLKKEWGCR